MGSGLVALLFENTFLGERYDLQELARPERGGRSRFSKAQDVGVSEQKITDKVNTTMGQDECARTWRANLMRSKGFSPSSVWASCLSCPQRGFSESDSKAGDPSSQWGLPHQ